MTFGKYLGESNVAILNTVDGRLWTRLLRKSNLFKDVLKPYSSRPPKIEVPITLPTKTGIYAKDVIHEQGNSATLYRTWQEQEMRLLHMTMKKNELIKQSQIDTRVPDVAATEFFDLSIKVEACKG